MCSVVWLLYGMWLCRLCDFVTMLYGTVRIKCYGSKFLSLPKVLPWPSIAWLELWKKRTPPFLHFFCSSELFSCALILDKWNPFMHCPVSVNNVKMCQNKISISIWLNIKWWWLDYIKEQSNYTKISTDPQFISIRFT